MDQPPAVALTAFADAWPRAIETEIVYCPGAIHLTLEILVALSVQGFQGICGWYGVLYHQHIEQLINFLGLQDVIDIN